MKFGFVKVAVCSPEIKVADTVYNADAVIKTIDDVIRKDAELIVFPELCLTGATCGDLFLTKTLLSGAESAVLKIAQATVGKKALIFLGAPVKNGNLIYDTAIAISDGKVLAVIPKTIIPKVGENSDVRVFAECPFDNSTVNICGQKVPFGSKIIFEDSINPYFTVGAEIGGDLLSPLAPSTYHALNGANIIVNLSAFAETVGSREFYLSAVSAQSNKCACGYVLSCAGRGESTTDQVYGGQKIIVECGKTLVDYGAFTCDAAVSEIDCSFIDFERAKTLNGEMRDDGYQRIEFNATRDEFNLTRAYEKTPFVPNGVDLTARAEHILSIQAEGLYKRLKHTNASSAVLGLSGGLDSTLAILVAVTAMKKLNRPLKDVIAVTMPCFGTTSRTYLNTIKLSKALGVTLKKVDIGKATKIHLKDIKHPDGVYDAAYENAQARERTQVLMDLANMNNGLVVGTGDLSELALGWATYNGDHMSMYAVNCTIPKTLVRHIVEVYAKKSKGKLKAVLEDILDTPVSPELLPAENDDIAQRTEDIVGPYILHDFFLFNMIRKGFSPEKLYAVACYTFKGDFREETILKWLKIFTRRFFNQQFKRSCVPDGVKVGSVALSPRGAFTMPSDAVSRLWLDELENL
ncbi:MAG: NAD(+) synthase [Clostridia bacterium]|nr:NAD(+) synthase [Clostridia bacterium]